MDFRAIKQAIDDIAKSGYNRVDFHIHTYGGDVIEGNLIYNFIAGFKGEVDMYIDGVVASMGAIIAMAGTRVHIAENGFIMIHSPQGGVYGTAKQMTQTARLLTSMENNFKLKLKARTGKSEKEVNAWFDGTDYWFNADECVESGLASDKVIAKVENVTTLDKSEAMQIGAEATFQRFAALLADPPINNQKKAEMNKEDLIKRYGLTGVTAQSADDEVLAAVDAKVNAGTTAQKEAENQTKATLKKACEVAVDAAISAKKLTPEQRDQYVARGERLGIDELNAILADLRPYEPIAPQIQSKGTETAPEDRKNWTWDDYQAKALAEIDAMPKKDSAKFKALYKAKYGVDPEL